MTNLSNFFPWLSIRSKLLIAFAGLSILPLVIIGVYGIVANVRTMQDIALENLSHDVLTTQGEIANLLESIESDLRVIRYSAALEKFMSDRANVHHSAKEDGLERLSHELLTFAKAKDIYCQLQIVNDDGDELLCVEAVSAKDSSTVYRIVPAQELRRASKPLEHLLTGRPNRGQITLTAAELVNGQNERVPVFRFAMPLVQTEQRFGILIATVFAKHLMQIVEGERHSGIVGKIVLVAGDGQYLYHSEKKRDWSRLLASQEEGNLRSDYPRSIADAILSGGEGTLTEESGEIISYVPLFSRRNDPKSALASSGLMIPIVVFESVSRDAVMAPARSFAWVSALFVLLFLGGAVGLGLIATRQFTRPIGELWRGAGVIAKGNYGHRLRVETHDEIEKLADQFNSMAESLEARDEEIQQHRAKLEETLTQRTRELVEETTRLQIMLDNVPSAFVLVDKDFRIRMASAMFAKVTGLDFEDVRGMDCRVVFSRDGVPHDCVCRQAFLRGDVESHIDCIDDRKGGERFIEHIAIPVKEGGQIVSILEIITDVTQRKRFEEQLLHTERLMAVGEMSSLIAHEFRNSLTSVKMIMQLQRESERLSRSEKRSIAVALSSIGHMEGVVTELLTFARPKPMVFRVERLNTVIKESVALALPRINRSRIVVTTMLDRTLPPFLLDASHLKEALVNILLNAVQACECATSGNQHAEIRIRTKRLRLSQVLCDLSDAKSMGGESMGPIGNGIELKRGTECALIEIRDTGCGIERVHLDRVFDPFFTTKANGTGLGLPLVKRTINAHGGVVSVKSKRGRGAVFSIHLPFTSVKVSLEE